MFSPQFFDIFGILIFAYVIVFSARGLRGAAIPRWAFFVFLFIGIAGFLVDAAVVFTFYFR